MHPNGTALSYTCDTGRAAPLFVITPQRPSPEETQWLIERGWDRPGEAKPDPFDHGWHVFCYPEGAVLYHRDLDALDQPMTLTDPQWRAMARGGSVMGIYLIRSVLAVHESTVRRAVREGAALRLMLPVTYVKSAVQDQAACG